MILHKRNVIVIIPALLLLSCTLLEAEPATPTDLSVSTPVPVASALPPAPSATNTEEDRTYGFSKRPWPFPFAQEVDSIEDAQQRVSFNVPLPPMLAGEWEPQEVWVSRAGEEPENQAVWVLFSNGVQYSIHPSEGQPNFEALSDGIPQILEIEFDNRWGIGAEREVRTLPVRGEFLQPAVAVWWQLGTKVNLTSEQHSLVELLEIAPIFARGEAVPKNEEPLRRPDPPPAPAPAPIPAPNPAPAPSPPGGSR